MGWICQGSRPEAKKFGGGRGREWKRHADLLSFLVLQGKNGDDPVCWPRYKLIQFTFFLIIPVSPFSLRLASFSSLNLRSYLFLMSRISRSASSSICFFVSSYSRSCCRVSSCDCVGKSNKFHEKNKTKQTHTLKFFTQRNKDGNSSI